MPPRPLQLADAPKAFFADVEKTTRPEETVRLVRERLARLDLDILRETRRIDSGRLGIPVYFSVCGTDARRTIGNRKQMGKGATPAQAEASAVMELVERFSFFGFIEDDAHFTTAPHAALGPAAISLDRLARSVHDTSDHRTAALAVLAELPLRWAWAFDLAADRWCQIPFDWFYALNAHNGPAAGNCLEEAICQGVCEVVERDVSARIARRREPLPGIDADRVTDPVARDLIDKYRRAGIEVHLSDFSLDTGIPTVGVLAWDPATFPDRSEIVWTAGTAASPVRALSRALTEVAQLAGDFDHGAAFEASGLPKFSRIEQADFVTRPATVRPLEALPDLSHADFRVEAERLAAALARQNRSPLVMDITHPRIEVPSAYAIVPGAHFRERTASLCVGMLTAKLIAETRPAEEALARLADFDHRLPGQYYIPFYRGTLHLAAGRPEAAEDHFAQALALHPPDAETADILTYQAITRKEAGRYAEAIEDLTRVAALDSDRTDVHNLLGFCHFKQGDHEAAVADFQAVLARNPGSAIDHANLGVNYQALGRRQEAIAAYETALALDPTIDFALENLLALQDDE